MTKKTALPIPTHSYTELAVSMTWSGFTRTLPYRFTPADRETAERLVQVLNEVLSPTFTHKLVEIGNIPGDRYEYQTP